MKAKQEYVEGAEAFTRFRGAMQKALTVSHSEIQRRIEADNRQRAAITPRKRGPKPKSA